MNSLRQDLNHLAQRQAQQSTWGSERLRFHLMPPAGWLNDPNGLCYFAGEYHVFFQYAPFSVHGGLKMWGHYASPDLLHWRFLGTPLLPDQPFDLHGVYSGSAWCENGQMHLFYTGNVKLDGDYDYIHQGRGSDTIYARLDKQTGQAQGKKVLLSRVDYPEDTTCHVRDPKVWKKDGQYQMVLGARRQDDVGEVLWYTSKDMHKWELARRMTTAQPFGYMWECPDYFELENKAFLAVCPQGVPQEPYRFQNIYQSGWFTMQDGQPQEFTSWDYGTDFYAPQSFADEAGRRLLIGWMGMPDADYHNLEQTWQHALTIPRELTVTPEGRLRQQPARELMQLRGTALTITDDLSHDIPRVCELLLENAQNHEFILHIGGAQLQYAQNMLTLSFTEQAVAQGRPPRMVSVRSCKQVRIFADISSLEIFIEDGQIVFTTRFYPQQDALPLQAIGQALSMTVYPLQAMEMQ